MVIYGAIAEVLCPAAAAQGSWDGVLRDHWGLGRESLQFVSKPSPVEFVY